MIDHGRCREAPYTGRMRWECVACGAALALGLESTGAIAFAPGLVPQPVRHGGLLTYGPEARVRLRGGTPHAMLESNRVRSPFPAMDFYVYCPVCGRGQHVRRRKLAETAPPLTRGARAVE
jgi:rubredoxin